jgi:ribosomal protein S12 methylthiotransferase
VNTCGFIAPAREESCDLIEEAIAWKKENGGIVAVIGCLAQRDLDGLQKRFPETDVIAGFGGYAQLGASLETALRGQKSRLAPARHYDIPQADRPLRLTGGATAYLKLGEGCSKRCSFCAIPYFRGDQKSVPPDRLAQRARSLAEQGVKELILIAQDPVTYGRDLSSQTDLFTALDRLEEVEGIEWIRLHYLFPGRTALRVLERMRLGGKLCPYLDLPIQHGHPDILHAMNRPALEPMLRPLHRARQEMQGLTLRTTFIVGFPGEEERHFERSLRVLEEIEFDRVGVFGYSPEEGTPAARLPGRVPGAITEERKERLMRAAAEISRRRNAGQVGKTVPVIVDHTARNGRPNVGRTQGQSPDVDGVCLVEGTRIEAGTILPVRITGHGEHDLVGATTGNQIPLYRRGNRDQYETGD